MAAAPGEKRPTRRNCEMAGWCSASGRRSEVYVQVVLPILSSEQEPIASHLLQADLRKELSVTEIHEQEEADRRRAQTRQGANCLESISRDAGLERTCCEDGTGDKEFHQLRNPARGAEKMSMVFLDIDGLTESDEIGEVDFKSANCVHSFGSITMQEIARLGGERIRAICQERCSCGNDSGLLYKKGMAADTVTRLDNLCDLLPKYMKRPTAETRWMVQELIKGCNLKLRFRVKRAE